MGRPATLVRLDVPATLLMIAALMIAPRWGLVGVALVHLIFNIAYCVARLAVVRAVTGVSGRSLGAAVLPAVGVAAVTAAVGFGLAAVLPSGRLLSLVLLSVACAVAIGASAMLFARSCGPRGSPARLVRPRSSGMTNAEVRSAVLITASEPEPRTLRQTGGDRRAARPPESNGWAPTGCTSC